MRSLIFLDVDGVLNPTHNMIEEHEKGNSTLPEMIHLDESCLNNLLRIVQKTGAEIVVSSTWRLSTQAMDNLEVQLSRKGINIVGCTTFSRMGKRGQEIMEYLNNKEECPYVILDDDDFDIKDYVPPYTMVKIDGYKGITERDADLAVYLITKQKAKIMKEANGNGSL